MENIAVIRERFNEAKEEHTLASGADAEYYLGKMIGIAEGVAACLNISWIEADTLLRKTQ